MNTYIMNKIFTTMIFCAATTTVAAQTDLTQSMKMVISAQLPKEE